jgi:tetratricopeptide (TPR) repeat protein
MKHGKPVKHLGWLEWRAAWLGPSVALGLTVLAHAAMAQPGAGQPLPQIELPDLQKLFAVEPSAQPAPPTDDDLLRALEQPLPQVESAIQANPAAPAVGRQLLEETWLPETMTAADNRQVKELFGVTPGRSTSVDVANQPKWGRPLQEVKAAEGLAALEFQLAPWKKATLLMYDGIVHVIRLEAAPADYTPQQAAAAFQLGTLRLLPAGKAGAGEAAAEFAVYASTTHHALLIFRRLNGRMKFTQLVLSFGNDLMVALSLDAAPVVEAVLREGIVRRSRAWPLRYFYVGSLAQQERFDEAIAAGAAALEFAPKENANAFRLLLGNLYRLTGRNREALDSFSRMLQDDPQNSVALGARGDILVNMGEHERALADYRAYLVRDINQPAILNNAAWVMATSPHAALRNGRLAVRLALRANQLTDDKQPHIWSTLAAAFAETGDFDAAVTWAAKAVDSGTDDAKEQMRAERESYRQRKPWRTKIPEQRESTR